MPSLQDVSGSLALPSLHLYGCHESFRVSACKSGQGAYEDPEMKLGCNRQEEHGETVRNHGL